MLRRVAERRLDEAYPYLILDARYEKVRIDGVNRTQAVFVAIGINAGRSHRVHVLSLGGGQSAVISASRMTAASLPPNVEENTVMPAKLYSRGASFISLCIVPVRFVASRM